MLHSKILVTAFNFFYIYLYIFEKLISDFLIDDIYISISEEIVYAKFITRAIFNKFAELRFWMFFNDFRLAIRILSRIISGSGILIAKLKTLFFKAMRKKCCSSCLGVEFNFK